MDYREKYDKWLSDECIDEATKEELKNLTDEKEIEDRFYKDLEFGTAGMRGKLGAGTNRMNSYTVKKATQGLANYINKVGRTDMPVGISYDPRHRSGEFANEVALVLNASGIKTYISEKLSPIPVLSFAIRNMKLGAGIMITASHNPKEYNGYKVLWDDGCQINAIDKDIMEEINKIKSFEDIKTMNIEKAKEEGLYNIYGKEIDDAYIKRIKEELLNEDVCREYGKDINIVYTPLNGTGNVLVRRVLDEIGFTNVHVVKEHENPDPDFTTVPNPNPEYPEVYKLGIEEAKRLGADVVMATDPDADRFGMVARDKDGEYKVFTGNMIGSMITEYILSMLKEKGSLKGNEVFCKTIVTTNLIDKIVASYGVTLESVFTGFKYIGAVMNACERDPGKNFIFGFEESFGYTKGTHVRDKDGVVTTMVVSEIIAYCMKKGITIFDFMNSIYEKYGYYEDVVKSVVYEGKEGAEKIAEIMKKYRENELNEIAGIKVKSLTDYKESTEKDMQTGDVRSIDFEKSNVIKYILEDGSFICTRPSGTEPKIKYYFSIIGTTKDEAKSKLEKIMKEYLA